MDTGIRGFPRGDMRVSDAERDQAVTELSGHYQAGRLTAEEFGDRSGRALQARTRADLAGLFTDLPQPAVSAAGGRPVPAAARRPRPWPFPRPARAALLCGVAAIVIGLVLAGHWTGHRAGFGLPVPVMVLVFIVRRRLSRRR
jgi:Domain of unknown function (DUF1707)